MSSASFIVTAEEVSSLITTVNCGIAVFSMLTYDWLICLDQEIALIWNWKARRTVAPLVYVLVRYMPIVGSIFTVATISPMSLLSCEAVGWVQLISEALSEFALAGFSTMRTYALSGKSVYMAIITFILSVVPMITTLHHYIKFDSSQVLPRPFNCSDNDQIPQQLNYELTIITRTCMIAADLLVIVITWFYTYKLYKIQKNLRLGSSLWGIMLYNGSLYFVVLVSLNVLDMVLTALQIESAFISTGSYVTTFLDPISYILISRFFLNLRQVDRKIVDPSSLPSNQDGNMTIQFATLPAFIGSLGEPVHTDSAVDPELDFEQESPEHVLNTSSGPESEGEIVEVSRV